MRFLITILFALPLMGLSNKVTLQDKAGASHGTRQFVIPRYFAQDEICSNPKPYIGGVAVTYWQSHVENRWPASAVCAGGAVKFAVIIIETTLSSGENKDVAFRNSTDSCYLGDSATCAAAGMSKTHLLDFDAGGGLASWGAKIQATTGGIIMSRSARAMISSDHYQIIRNGPIYAEVLVREGPDAVSGATTRTTSFGWKCTANCVGPYTASTWADDPTYYTIRPTFWLRFYRRWQKVEVDYVGHSGWMDRFADQRIESYELMVGGAENVAAIQQTNPFILSPRQTWWEGPVWNGGTPLRSNIDFNTPYLVASRLIPPLNTATPPSAAAIASEYASFTSSDQGVTTSASLTPGMGAGMTSRAIAAGGANTYSIGLFPRWTARYLATMDADLYDEEIGNARGVMHFPVVYLESKTSGMWTSGEAANPFGKTVSVELRPTFVSWYSPSTLTATGDAVTSPDGVRMASACAGCYVHSSGGSMQWISSSSASWNSSYMDKAHQSNDLFIPYIITGKRLFLEQLQAQAAWSAATTPPDAGLYYLGRQRERGLIDAGGNFPRGMYWTVKALGWAAVASPDGSPEKTYFTRLLNNNIEVMEGVMQLTGGSFPPSSTTAPYGCPSATATAYYGQPSSYASAWCLGRYVWMRGLDNQLGFPGLQSWPGGSPAMGVGSDIRYGTDFFSAWMFTYGAVTYGHLRDLGVTAIVPIQEAVSKWFMKAVADSASGQDWSILFSYRTTILNATSTGVHQTPTELKNGIRRDVTLARAATPTSTAFYSNMFASAGNHPAVDSTDLTGCPIRVGSEIFVLDDWTYTQSIYWRGGITASTDQLVFTAKYSSLSGQLNSTGVHDFANGDLITVSNGTTSSIVDLPLAADTANCASPSGKAFCTYYVKVIDTTTIELYKDAALTQRVDFTSDVAASNVYAGISEWKVKTSELGRCGGVSCRGVQGTAATSHSVGEAMGPVGSWMRQAYMADPEGYPAEYHSALAYAATYGAAIADSLTGKPITGTRAYGLMSALTGYQNAYPDNPRWGWIAWSEVAPTNVRVAGGTGSVTLRWVAPDGGACRYVVAAALNDSDDSSDTSDGGGHKSRAATVGGLGPGTYVYRITCGSGRATGTVTVM